MCYENPIPACHRNTNTLAGFADFALRPGFQRIIKRKRIEY